MKALLLLLPIVVFAGCIGTGEEIRGRDHVAVTPSVVARIPLGRVPEPRRRAVSYQAAIEVGTSYLEGDFTGSPGRVHYDATTVHAAFSPEVGWNGVYLCPLVGGSYSAIEVDAGSASAGDVSGLAVIGGAEARWCAGWFEPYARYVKIFGGDQEIDRLDLGLGWRFVDSLAIRLGWAQQTTEVEDFLSTGASNRAHIESDGVHVGLALRF